MENVRYERVAPVTYCDEENNKRISNATPGNRTANTRYYDSDN